MNLILAKIKKLYTTGAFHIFGSTVLNKAIVFISNMVIVRILTKVEYGTYTYAANIFNIIMLFNGMGVDIGILQVCSEKSGDEEFAEKMTNFATRFGIAFDVLMGLVVLGIGLFAPMEIPAARPLLCMMALRPLPKLLGAMNSVYLRSQQRNHEMAWISVLTTVLNCTITALLAWILREPGVVWACYIASVISLAVTYWKCRIKLFNNSPLPSKEERKSLLSISAISMCNVGLSQLLYLLGGFILGIVSPDEAVLASYKVATVIPSALSFIPSAVMVYLYPYFAKRKDDGKWCLQKYKQVLLVMGALNACISIGLFVLAPLIVRIIYGVAYLDCVPIFRMLAINYFFAGTFRTISGTLLVTQRKLKFNLFVAVLSGVLTAVLNYFFILKWGSVGAAMATICVVLLTSVMNTVYLVYTFKKKQKQVICEE